ncbi:KTSC domain-containing protein [Microcoleus sp. LEGE 07076]|uniref:KTSC domain-containing protein n=1 Tax=Microcoleus sp. LEGE 07076 TaxID=915322 RepID=UPI0030DD86CB
MQDVRYNQQNQVLQIQFSSGSVYQYTHVEPEIWESLQDTDSTGRFFHSQIKGYYSSQPVDDESLNANGSFNHQNKTT